MKIILVVTNLRYIGLLYQVNLCKSFYVIIFFDKNICLKQSKKCAVVGNEENFP